jgi:poly(3-hydroxybutyrate) depolymerase
MFRMPELGLGVSKVNAGCLTLVPAFWCAGLGCQPSAVARGGDASLATQTTRDSGSPETDVVGCPKLQAQGTAPLIDDFENAQQITTAEDRAGYWIFYNDGTSGEQDVQHVADGSTVLQIDSSGWSSWGSGFGVRISQGSTLEQLCPYDASVYSGLSFKAKGTGRVRVRLAMRENTPTNEGGDCTLPGEECYDWPGIWLNLKPEWTNYSLPFCAFKQEGWSGTQLPLAATRLGGIHFRLDGKVKLALDELQFAEQPEGDAGACAVACPLDSAPSGAVFAPTESYLPLSERLTLHTFEQLTPRCGLLTRRYISYVPEALVTPSSAPVLIALHGSGATAEAFQELMAHGQLDTLAERDGVIVVYGNAAPGLHTDPSTPNSGAWRQDYFDDDQVDDVEYLAQLLGDLRERGVITGTNAVYLTGISNGAGMVLKAAKSTPARFAGIAPFMPFDGFRPEPVPDLQGTGLTKVVFGYAPEDPGVPKDYGNVMSKLPAEWGVAMGMPAELLRSPATTQLPNVVAEGDTYTGNNPVALATRNSTVTQQDFKDPNLSTKLSVFVFNGAGHFWPSPVPDTAPWILERWGFRNQDLDAAEAVWTFFFKD